MNQNPNPNITLNLNLQQINLMLQLLYPYADLSNELRKQAADQVQPREQKDSSPE